MLCGLCVKVGPNKSNINPCNPLLTFNFIFVSWIKTDPITKVQNAWIKVIYSHNGSLEGAWGKKVFFFFLVETSGWCYRRSKKVKRWNVCVVSIHNKWVRDAFMGPSIPRSWPGPVLKILNPNMQWREAFKVKWKWKWSEVRWSGGKMPWTWTIRTFPPC